jgi:hypothetical protein
LGVESQSLPDDEDQAMRFTIRELLMLTTIVALSLGMIIQRMHHRAVVRANQQQWRDHEAIMFEEGFFKIGKHVYKLDNQGYVIFDEKSALTPEALPYYPAMSYPEKK